MMIRKSEENEAHEACVVESWYVPLRCPLYHHQHRHAQKQKFSGDVGSKRVHKRKDAPVAMRQAVTVILSDTTHKKVRKHRKAHFVCVWLPCLFITNSVQVVIRSNQAVCECKPRRFLMRWYITFSSMARVMSTCTNASVPSGRKPQTWSSLKGIVELFLMPGAIR